MARPRLRTGSRGGKARVDADDGTGRDGTTHFVFAFYTGAVMTRMYLGTLETVLFVALTTTIEGFEDGFSHRRVDVHVFQIRHGEVVEDAAGDAVRGECTGKVSPTVVIEPS